MPVPKREVRKLWAQMPNENSKWYQRFTAFMAMGPQRTFAKLQRELGLKRRHSIEIAAKQFNWLERAAAYDQEGAANFLQDIEDVRNNILTEIVEKAPEYLKILDDIAHGRNSAPESKAKPSTRLQAAIKGLELAGFVPPKRESRERKDEALESARGAAKGMDTETLQGLLEVLNRKD